MSTQGKKLPARASDLTGKRFGSLEVLARHGNSAGGSATWVCRCDCGNTTTSAGSDLRRGRTWTCGCGSAEAARRRHAEARDLDGQRFGRLTVIAFAGLNSYPRALWLCRCDCGEEVNVTGHHLTAGETVSCGCRGREVMALRPTWLIKSVVGYVAAHGRVKTLHGAARTHLCVDCLGPAEDWSYDHEDSSELTDKRGRSYSMNPSHYWPRCRLCHKSFDSAVSGTASVDAREGEIA